MENAPVGVKLEEFYLALSQQPPNVEWIIDSMHLMEDHQPLRQHNETAEVVSEIVKDCRKKCAQQLRAPFAEVIRNVIAACRKRLVSKAALDSESSLQHNQRHLNTLLELLGTWSNIVAQCVAFGFSRALTRQILSPLYTRILEASVECFKTFKRDKELEQWSVRSLDESAECNVGSLDFLTSQVAGIKELVHQHYSFLYNNFCDYDVDGVPEPAGVAVMESMLIVTPEELLQWRELDALYVTMEFGFVQRASQEALKEKELIEVENSVFLPQCIEDIFFVLNKVSERALSTGSESNIFSIGNRIIEAIRETPPQEYDKHSVLYRIVTSAMFYHHCIARRAVSGRALTRIINGPRRSAPSSSKLNTPMKDSFASNGNSSSGGNNSTYSTPAKGLVGSTSLAQMILGNSEDGAYYSNTLPSSPAMGLASALSDVASVSLTGVNWWLADQLSPYLKADDNSGSAAANPPTAAGPPLGMTQGSRVASSGNMGIAMQDTPSPCNNGTAGSGANNTTISSPPQSTHGRAPLPPTGGGFNTPAKPPNGNNRLVAHTSPPVSNNGRNSATTSGEYSSAPVSAPSNLSLDQLLLNALVGEEDSDNDDDQYGTSVDVSAVLQYRTLVDTAEGAFYIDRVDEMRHRLPLCEADWVVQLNTLCMVVSCIGSLKSTYQRGSGVAAIYKAPVNNGTNKSGGGPIDILLQVCIVFMYILFVYMYVYEYVCVWIYAKHTCVVKICVHDLFSITNTRCAAVSVSNSIIPLYMSIFQELSTCEAQYNSILTKETQLFAKWIFISQMETQLLQFCAM